MPEQYINDSTFFNFQRLDDLRQKGIGGGTYETIALAYLVHIGNHGKYSER